MAERRKSNTQRMPDVGTGPSLHDFKEFARSFFTSTTGMSPNVDMAQRSLHGDLKQVPLSRQSVDRLVDAENFMSKHGPSNTFQDKLASAFTPMRRIVAHSVARQMVVSQMGIHSDHEYAQEQRMFDAFNDH